MSFHSFYKRASFILILMAFLHVMHGHSEAGTEVEQIQKEVVQAIEIRQETQEKEDTWAGKKADLMSRYRRLISRKENLEKAKTGIKERLKAQENLVAEAERRTRESECIRDELQSCLEFMVTRLEELIKRDLPFLPGGAVVG